MSTIYHGSDQRATRQLHQDLEAASDAGPLAVALLRTQKASTRAKAYKGDSKSWSYIRKSTSIDELCQLLSRQQVLKWGWGRDESMKYFSDVLYVDLPTGQISFHAEGRSDGPDYPGVWDRKHASEERIIDFAAAALAIGSE